MHSRSRIVAGLITLGCGLISIQTTAAQAPVTEVAVAPALAANDQVDDPSQADTTAGATAEAAGKVQLVAHTALIENRRLALPLSGIVAEVNVHVGQTVAKGDKLLRLDDEAAQLQLAMVETELDAARLASNRDPQLQLASHEYEVRKLTQHKGELANQVYDGVVSETDLRKLQLETDRAQLVIEGEKQQRALAGTVAQKAQTKLMIVKSNLDRHVLRSAVAGQVVEVTTRPGEWAAAGQTLVRVVSLNRLRVICHASPAMIPGDLQGHAVRFIPESEAGGNVSLTGKVTFVSPEINPANANVVFWADVDNPDGKVRAGAAGVLELQ
ncbi:efflux RND transporter periplasmic adaptor subunit [Rhodopirellula sp. MGV]|uniref:efflux RND transporter periplasmic adaptor subunit n=1 Tax=Rhodopirellula sp. MGV TaxID=2023130 RepID=UPI000B95FB0A|nr:HlyD family efflux transporter periplasmic adaptor subunit [Rhodopirellula sp. MGV]OYP29992.1 hypothetical protein CGZ80_23530 [Rhodopirellula sp. MGV]PNY33446.1 hypothetical protein C2E31_28535 [Rhodopirellula baltica]